MNKYLFISYTTRDGKISKDFLTDVFRFYSEKYNVVYIDLLQPKTLNWQERVVQAIKNATDCILIKTNLSFESEWVLFELDLMKTMNKKTLIIPFEDISILLQENSLIDR